MADRERKEGKTEYLKNEKSFLNEIKSIFHNNYGLSFGENERT